MFRKKYSRREFVKKNSLAGIGAAFTMSMAPELFANSQRVMTTPAILGGGPVRTAKWPSWPKWDEARDEKLVFQSIRSGVWSRADLTSRFEQRWAQMIGTKRCLATVNGTNALIAALAQLDIGGGDEVIVPPYTFIATTQSILMNGAMPVFVDTDPETFQIDVAKIEAKITPRTRAILPVHILGLPANMPVIMEIARKHKLVVVEDACQAWLAEMNGKKMGSWGDAGCFSFQNSKNLAIGEGGAITSDNEEFMDRCFSYHNYGNPYGAIVGEVGAGTVRLGTKIRTTEYQSAIGLVQLERLEAETNKRNENAAYLKSKIQGIPGILPYKLYEGVTKASFHLFPFTYKEEEFKGLSRAGFLRALSAEGIPASGGYAPLNKMPYLRHAFNTKNFQKMYPSRMLDYNRYMSQNQCPVNDRVCEEAVWFSQSMLLAEKSDMDDIANAIEKIHKNAGEISKSI
jgi:perosamine synthetase